MVTFLDEKGRNEYLPHPEHKKFVKLLNPILDNVFVIDCWSRQLIHKKNKDESSDGD
ncbi:MAG: Dabb family protein [Verrucomicrobiota bacterium]|nr:Dabb family protein [Verrucomicrobiota bacterium]